LLFRGTLEFLACVAALPSLAYALVVAIIIALH
jgi:hypothetical protein